MATIKTLLGNVKGKDGGGYEEVVLYDGNCSACINSNIIISSSAMIELSDSIENYKSIRIEYLTYDGRGEGAGLIYNLPIVVSVDYIKTTYGYNSISTGVTGSNGSNFSFGFYNDKHLAQTWATHGSLAHNMSHITVTGIRDKVPDAEKNFNKYSTTEEVVGTWIDGKPIYRKVVSCGTLPDRTEKRVAHGIKNFGHIINVSGYCEDTNYNYPLPFAYNALNGDGCISIWADKTDIVISCLTTYYPDVTASYVILEYTKTTD